MNEYRRDAFKTSAHRGAYDTLAGLLERIASRNKFPNLRLKLADPGTTPALPEVAWEVCILLELESTSDKGEWHGAIRVLGVKGLGRLLVRFHPGGEEALVGAARPLVHIVHVLFADDGIDSELIGGDPEEAIKDYVSAAIDSLDWSDVDEQVSWHEAEEVSAQVDAALEIELLLKME